MQVIRGLEVVQNKVSKSQRTSQSTLLAIDPISKKVNPRARALTNRKRASPPNALNWIQTCRFTWASLKPF